MPAPYRGGCLCGAIRYEVTAAPLGAGYCHCSLCRRATGAPIFLGVAFPRESFRMLKGRTKTHASSARGIRHFCGACGSALFFELLDKPNQWEVLAGSLDDPGDVQPSIHVCVSNGVGWLHINDGLPRKP